MQYRRTTLIIIIHAFCLFPIAAFARAGGGTSKCGGTLTLLALIITFVYRALQSYYASLKETRVISLLDKISKHNSEWEYNLLKDRTKKCYFKIQKAWKDGNPDIAKEHTSVSFYNKHKVFCQKMAWAKKRNIMKNIKLKEIKIVAIHDFQDDREDAYWAYVRSSMIDYTILESTGKVVDGHEKNATFTELWHFTRSDSAWVLNEIKSDIKIDNIIAMQSFSK